MDEAKIIMSLAALAHEHRLRIFRLLVRVGPLGLPAGEIAEKVGISPTNTSFHLKELDRAGLIHATRDGRYIRYAILVEGMRELRTSLDLIAGGSARSVTGEPALAGLKELLGPAVVEAFGEPWPRT
jgi:ArsR family transcriptional regulator, arsenate/arsenite/antimonite-responsive transcriptional repressor